MVAGRVVRFDSARGYGFIAPDTGADDVFLHVNDLLIPESYVRSGLAVEFEVEDGGRGLKASAIRLAQTLETPAKPTVPAAAPPPVAVPAQAPSPAVLAARSPASPQVTEVADTEETLCDVLSAAEHAREVTELLLEIGDLTGEQIVHIRQGMLKFAKGHGWIDG